MLILINMLWIESKVMEEILKMKSTRWQTQVWRYSLITLLLTFVSRPLPATPYIFSSPEHEVLMVSYCDMLCPSCVVRRPSSTFYLLYVLEATFSVQSSWNLVRMFVLIKSRKSLKLGHVGSKTRSLGQILEKPCVCSRCHIFSQILVKFGLNVCLDKI